MVEKGIIDEMFCNPANKWNLLCISEATPQAKTLQNVTVENGEQGIKTKRGLL